MSNRTLESKGKLNQSEIEQLKIDGVKAELEVIEEKLENGKNLTAKDKKMLTDNGYDIELSKSSGKLMTEETKPSGETKEEIVDLRSEIKARANSYDEKMKKSCKVLAFDLNNGNDLVVATKHGNFTVNFSGNLFGKFKLTFKIEATNIEGKVSLQTVKTVIVNEFAITKDTNKELRSGYYSEIENLEDYYDQIADSVKAISPKMKTDQVLLIALIMLSDLGIIGHSDESGLEYGKVDSNKVLKCILDTCFKLLDNNVKIQGILTHHLTILVKLYKANQLSEDLSKDLVKLTSAINLGIK